MSGRLRVLLVDDEPALLQGLRRAGHRDAALSLETAVGAPAALEVLGRGRVDVLVTDMRMPGMSGQELLAEVHARWPGTARLVLSGQADRRDTLGALPLAHQLLAKPCRWPDLGAAIHRAGRLASIPDDELRAAVGRLSHLATRPPALEALAAALADGDTPAVCNALMADVALSAKVLQVANSTVFGAAQPIADVVAAVTFLGVDVLQRILDGRTGPLPTLPGPATHPEPALPGLGARALAAADQPADRADHEWLGGIVADLWGLPRGDHGLQEAG